MTNEIIFREVRVRSYLLRQFALLVSCCPLQALSHKLFFLECRKELLATLSFGEGLGVRKSLSRH